MDFFKVTERDLERFQREELKKFSEKYREPMAKFFLNIINDYVAGSKIPINVEGIMILDASLSICYLYKGALHGTLDSLVAKGFLDDAKLVKDKINDANRLLYAHLDELFSEFLSNKGEHELRRQLATQGCWSILLDVNFTARWLNTYAIALAASFHSLSSPSPIRESDSLAIGQGLQSYIKRNDNPSGVRTYNL